MGHCRLQADPLGTLSCEELLKIYAALVPKNPMRTWHADKGSLVDRIILIVAGMPEQEVFNSPTAGILISRLLKFQRVPHESIVTIVKRRFPNSKITATRVKRLAHAMKEAA